MGHVAIIGGINDVHPHRALDYRTPREYIAQTSEARQAFRGQQQIVDPRGLRE